MELEEHNGMSSVKTSGKLLQGQTRKSVGPFMCSINVNKR
jgi:hypothetical protein